MDANLIFFCAFVFFAFIYKPFDSLISDLYSGMNRF